MTDHSILQNDGRSRICYQCGQGFTVKYPSYKRKYCSKECSNNAKRKGKRWTCEYCGKAFIPKNYASNARFCSKPCWYSWHKGENHQQYFRITKTCEWCGEKFKRNKFAIKRSERNYCSHECSSKAHSLKMRGISEGKPQESGYYQLAKWRKVRQQALRRDGYKCIMCGITNKEHKRLYKCGLHVDHIKRRRQGGTDDLNNLQSLCCVCHNKKTVKGK